MRTTKNILLGCLVSACMSACSTITHELPDDELSNQIPVNFSGTITTRVINNEWEEGDEVGIFMFSNGSSLSDNSLQHNASNRKYAYQTSTSSFNAVDDDDIIYYPITGSVDFIAYYPFSAVKDYSVELNTGNQQKQSQLDFLYSNNLTNISATQEAQKLIFKHQMSKVIFHITPGDGVALADLKGLSLSLLNIQTSGSFSLATGEISLAEQSRQVNTYVTETEDEIVAEAILIPQECKNKQITISLLSGQKFSFTFSSEHKNWAIGTKYDYDIELTSSITEGQLTGEISDWTTDSDAASDVTSGYESFEIVPWNGEFNTDWYSDAETELAIPSAEALAGLAKLVNEGVSFSGVTLNLLTDVDMANISWIPIGKNEENTFKGIFNGGGHIIKNLNPTLELSATNNSIAGLFGINNGEIQNTIVSGTYQLENSQSKYLQVGGICGQNNGIIYNCRSYADITASTTLTTDEQCIIYLGGISGINSQEEITDCENYGILSGVNQNTHDKAYTMVGGIVGTNQAKIENCENVQNLQATNGQVRIGGIAGMNTTKEDKERENILSTGSIIDCRNIGKIEITAAHFAAWAGGVVGLNQNGTTITSSSNKGNVHSLLTSGSNVYGGGIAGGNNNSYVRESSNEGDIVVLGCSAENGIAASGGIVGYNLNQGEIHTAIHSGYATASNMPDCYIGAITGLNDISETTEAYTFDCCTNEGIPSKWVGNATLTDDLITTTEHTDE